MNSLHPLKPETNGYTLRLLLISLFLYLNDLNFYSKRLCVVFGMQFLTQLHT